MRMVLDGDSTPNRVDLPLLKAVARARRWSDDLASGRAQSVDELAGGNGSMAAPYDACFGLGFCHQGSSRRSPKAASLRI
jgi:hypothetical protein